MTSVTEKVKALLAKADSSEHEAERDAFYAKAQELIIKHAIDEADLAPEEREKIIKVVIPRTPKRADDALFNAVCRQNSVAYITVGGPNALNGRQAWLIGFPTDIEFCQALNASLVLQREGDLDRAWSHVTGIHGKEYKASFRLHFAARIRVRLAEFASVACEDVKPGYGVVLADRTAQVNAHVAATQPGLVKTQVRASSAGREAGTASANRADVSGGKRNVGSGGHPALA